MNLDEHQEPTKKYANCDYESKKEIEYVEHIFGPYFVCFVTLDSLEVFFFN